jgi:hypothetical protein
MPEPIDSTAAAEAADLVSSSGTSDHPATATPILARQFNLSCTPQLESRAFSSRSIGRFAFTPRPLSVITSPAVDLHARGLQAADHDLRFLALFAVAAGSASPGRRVRLSPIMRNLTSPISMSSSAYRGEVCKTSDDREKGHLGDPDVIVIRHLMRDRSPSVDVRHLPGT